MTKVNSSIRQISKNIHTALVNDKQALSHEIVAVTSAVKVLTVPSGATYAFLQIQGAADEENMVRMWFDGGVPTNAEGVIRGHLDAFDINEAENLKKFKFIASAGASNSNLVIQYYK